MQVHERRRKGGRAIQGQREVAMAVEVQARWLDTACAQLGKDFPRAYDLPIPCRVPFMCQAYFGDTRDESDKWGGYNGYESMEFFSPISVPRVPVYEEADGRKAMVSAPGKPLFGDKAAGCER